MSDIPRAISVGRRVMVTGMAGAGKSTFSRALSAKTGLPIIVLDVHFWLPGWAKPTEAAWRALVRGIRTRPVDFELPNGCDESRLRRLRDEWCLVWRIWRVRRSERERELEILSQHGKHVAMYVLRSKRAVREFLDV